MPDLSWGSVAECADLGGVRSAVTVRNGIGGAAGDPQQDSLV